MRRKIKIAVASGKGGTGKTTVALALADAAGAGTLLLDCDVEQPNCHLFLTAKATEEPVTVLKPRVEEELCNGCGRCLEVCQFNAIALLGKKILLFQDLCHGCGGCVRVCPRGALREEASRIGEIGIGSTNTLSLIEGRLSIGQSMSPPLIRAVKEHSMESSGIVITDCPPGTACPMAAAVRDSDFVVLVTEPTPFGLHDLGLAVDILRLLKLPLGVIINRSDNGDESVQAYCYNKGIPVFFEIPNRREIAEAYSRGVSLLKAVPELRTEFEQVLKTIEKISGSEPVK